MVKLSELFSWIVVGFLLGVLVSPQFSARRRATTSCSGGLEAAATTVIGKENNNYLRQTLLYQEPLLRVVIPNDGNENDDDDNNKEEEQPTMPLVISQHALNNNTTTQERAAICTIVKTEEAYLDEWVDYHIGIGFHHIYIYDNSYHFDLQQWGAEQRQRRRPVSVFHHTGKGQQPYVYSRCTNMLKDANLAETVLFIDVDEFFVMRQYDHVHDFVQDHCAEGAVSMNWVHMGSANRSVYEPVPVLKRFDQKWADGEDARMNFTLFHSKTMARVQHIDLQRNLLETFNAHYVLLKKPYQRTDTHGQLIRDDEKMLVPRTDDVAAVYHYRTRSIKEYAEKFLRGRVGYKSANRKGMQDRLIERSSRKGWGYAEGNVTDTSVWDALVKHNPLYKVFEEKLSPDPTPYHASGEEAAICVIVQDDEAYLDEWVDYHRMLGFSRFYIFDRSPDFCMAQWGEEKGDFVTMMHGPTRDAEKEESAVREQLFKQCQTMALDHGKITWLAYLDVKDFVVLKSGFQTAHIMDLLSSFNEHDGIGVHQYMFGTAHRRIYEPKPVLQRFQYRDALADKDNYKTFVKIKRSDFNSAKLVNTDGNAMTATTSSYADRPVDKVVIHTHVYSQKEYLLRRYDFRALSEEASENDPEVWKVFGGLLPAGDVLDDSAWVAMKLMNPRYSVYDKLWQ